MQPVAEIQPSPIVTPRVVAFMDIGTNSIRLLLVRINPNHTHTILTSQKEVVRLGENEFVEGSLQPEAMSRAVLVCRKFVELARSNAADEIVAVATSATRDAENQKEFLDRLKNEAGIEVHVISGKEEARLIYQGVSSGVHIGKQKAIFIDIGGGSTEVVVGDQSQHYHLDSLKLGAIRLTSMFLPDAQAGPVSSERYQLIQRYVRTTAVRTLQRLQGYDAELAFGSSGTIINLAEVASRTLRKRPRERDEALSLRHLKETARMLCSLPYDERRDVPGINPERADIIIAGAAIIETLMEEFGLEELHISDRGLRDGLLADYLSRTGQGEELSQLSVRERSVLQLGRACGFDENHARTVTRLALDMFDSARTAGLHDLGDDERELLEHAAMLHDVGAFLSYNNHHAHSYYVIRNADLLGFDQSQIAVMAATALFHRKAFPRKKHPEFAALDEDEQEAVTVLCTLLRIAESLDRSHSGYIQSARLKALDKQRAALRLSASHDCQLELWSVENQKDDFERAFDHELTIEMAKKIAS
jgi:exopolyphosphatase/guanosine-5'-triphosphate,3'-diphosphate pyrophosphatase